MKKTLILQCPGMVCSPPVVSKCLGEAHRRLGVIYITLDYITLNPFFFSILLVIFFIVLLYSFHFFVFSLMKDFGPKRLSRILFVRPRKQNYLFLILLLTKIR